jgi:hypothetical protein
MKIEITEFDSVFSIDFTPETFAEVATLARLAMFGTKRVLDNSMYCPEKSGQITHSLQIGKASHYTSTLRRP